MRVLPVSLWRHLGSELGIPVPEVASLRALYNRGRTFFDHQQLACETLRLRWMSEHQRRALVQALREEVSRAADRRQLLTFARCWLNERRLLIAHDRILRALIADASTKFELDMATKIEAAVPERTLRRWRESLATPRSDGESAQA